MDDYVMTGATADELWPLVRDFHYSRRMPSAVLYGFSVRERGGLFGDTGTPVAGAIFSQPVSRRFNTQALELTRLVKKPEPRIILSEFVAFCLRWLKSNTTRPFVLSYADSAEGHHGGIYQACGFHYIGERGIPFNGLAGFRKPDGTFLHSRTASARLGTFNRKALEAANPDCVPVEAEPKHLYIFPLRQKWRTISKKYGWEAKPYPKPDFAARPLDERGSPLCEAGATPAGRSNLREARRG